MVTKGRHIKLTITPDDADCIKNIKRVSGSLSDTRAVRVALRICRYLIERGDDIEGAVDNGEDITEMFNQYTNWQTTADGDLSKLTKGKRHGQG